MKFTKMQGAGNDYVYVNCFEEMVSDPAEVSRYVSDRHFGIGSDGLILICPSEVADCRMDIYNADGSRALMCGNGVRCVAKYAYDHGIVPPERRELRVETLSGIKIITFSVKAQKAQDITVDMGEAKVTSEVPEKLVVDGETYEFVGISVGNPHAVIFLDPKEELPVLTAGPKIEMHPRFQPDRVNVEFAQVLDQNRIRMRVWERGSGETLACGTGATATAVAAMERGLVGEETDIELFGGTLHIRRDATNGHLFMTGPATEVFSGEIFLPESK